MRAPTWFNSLGGVIIILRGDSQRVLHSPACPTTRLIASDKAGVGAHGIRPHETLDRPFAYFARVFYNTIARHS